MPLHVLASGTACSLSAYTRRWSPAARYGGSADFGADHHLFARRWWKQPLTIIIIVRSLLAGVRGLVEHKAQASNAVAHRGDVVRAADEPAVDIGFVLLCSS